MQYVPVSLRMGLAIVSSREKLGVESAVVIRAATRAIIDFFAIDMGISLSAGDGQFSALALDTSQRAHEKCRRALEGEDPTVERARPPVLQRAPCHPTFPGYLPASVRRPARVLTAGALGSSGRAPRLTFAGTEALPGG
jgi:hypothetical protein